MAVLESILPYSSLGDRSILVNDLHQLQWKIVCVFYLFFSEMTNSCAIALKRRRGIMLASVMSASDRASSK